ncbi:unnamed protein product [Phytophthora fragariaefolia]|uniref:Unnamed protein product n=1 Tax=Phytophthora fragariaefolia TaxID=1490495 RepID=A0A9W7DB03_9STRA|nr:unnamed protein product [Phytophthora fragariaefolia]
MASSSPADAPLALLRAHLIAGKPVAVEGDSVVFRDAGGSELRRLPAHAPTAFHSKKLDKAYDLLAVLTCFQHAALGFSDYVLKCREAKAAMVSSVDKKELVAFLRGDVEASAQVRDAAAAAKKREPEREPRAAAAKKRRPERDARKDKTPAELQQEAQMRRIAAKECAQRSRTSVLDAHRTTFENVAKTLELVNAETKEKIEKASKASALLAATTARKEQLPLHRLVKDKILGTPIIVVPAGFSDLFTMLNARDFLEDGVYVSNMQKKAEGHRKQQSMMITHEEDGHVYTFKVVDTVSRFRDKDWCDVV